ncbi:MAG: Ig-like domain-containing protein [Isosphaeraceae bacterium]|nr:Ig-like domain-containing protein [Isosphaeraceae bacterium]
MSSSFLEILESRQLLASEVTISAANELTLASNEGNTLSVSYDSGTNTYTLNDTVLLDVFNNGTAVVNGSGTNTVTVSGITSLRFNNTSGVDQYNLTSLGHPTTISNTSFSNNTVRLGFGTNNAQAITGELTILSPIALTALQLLNSADATNHTTTLANNGLFGATPMAVNFDASRLFTSTLNLGSGNHDVTVGTTALINGVNLISGDGNDTYRFQDAATLMSGLINAGNGTNSIDYSLYTTGVVANLLTGTATGTNGITGFQNATGGSNNDTITAPNGTNSTLIGGGGADVLTAGSGTNSLFGGTGNDILNGSTGSTTFTWNNGDGSDVINGSAGFNIIVVNGSNGAGDVFNLAQNGSRVLFSRTNLGPFSLDIEHYDQMFVNGLGGDDVYTVDFSAGNPVGTTNFNYDGGTGSNTLNLVGGSFTNEIYAPLTGVFGSGTISLDSSVVRFSNLTPINDTTTATNFSFTFPGAFNAPRITDGPIFIGTQTTQISSGMPSPTFELINIGNKTNVDLINETAGDTITLNNATPAAGLATLDITSSGPGSSLRSLAAPEGVATTVFLGGSSVATVAAAGFPTTGSFTVDGGPGINTLNVDGAGTGSVTVGPNTITAGGASLTYLNFQTVNVPNALSTPPTIVAVNAFTAVSGTELIDQPIGTFSNTDLGLTAANFGATITWGDGSVTAGVITQDAADPTRFHVAGTHTYFGGAATPSLTLAVRNLGGSSTTVINGTVVNQVSLPSEPVSQQVAVTVADAAISAQGVPISTVENLPLSGVNVATFSVADLSAVASDYTATINWGDFTATSAGTITAVGSSPNGVSFVVSGNHTFASDGIYTISVQIASTGGSAAIAAATAFVEDGAITVIGNGVVATAGTPISNVTIGLISDSGGIEAPNSYTGTVNWGDGVAASTPIIALNGATLSVLGGHTFNAIGGYTGSVTVKSAGGSINTASLPITVFGLTATNLAVSATEDVALNRVPLVTLASNGGPAPVSTFYAASIDWGDASPITPGAVDSSLQVRGNHVYDEAGTYTVTITISIDGNPNLLVHTRTIVVADVPIVLTAKLDPASDSGISNTDLITNVIQPVFTGTSEPLSTVTVVATPLIAGPSLILGSTTTDAAGSWQLRSTVALADNTYNVVANAVDRNRATTASTTIGNITIDTVGPTVGLLTFNRLVGQVDLWLTDERSGLAQNSIIDNANYSMVKPHLRPGRLLFTSLTATPQTSPTASQRVTGILNSGTPLRGATYTFTAADGIIDVAGNRLDGEFYGYFPSGNRINGGNFVAIVDSFHNRVLPAKPSQGYGSPLNPPGTLAQGYTITRAGLVADANVVRFFGGAVPRGIYASTKKTPATPNKKVVAQAKPAAPKIVATRAGEMRIGGRDNG